MRSRLLLFVCFCLTLGGCAQPPKVRLEEVRNIVAHAYAAGAAEYAPGEYQLSSSALQAAEQQIKENEYRKARRTLELAQRYSAEALSLTIEIKKQLAAEQQRLTEQKKKKQLEQEQLQLLEDQRRQAELEEQERRLAEANRKRAAEELLRKESEAAALRKQAETQQKKTEPPHPLVNEIVVEAGATLATLAARADVYDDQWLWPLIYKSNRDQIKDPREIFVGQKFVIPRDKTRAEKDAARQEARALNLFPR